MGDQKIENNSSDSGIKNDQLNGTITQDASSAPNLVSGDARTANDLDSLLKQLDALKKDNFDYRERERKRKEAEEQEKQKFLLEQGKYKEALELLQKEKNTSNSDLEKYKTELERYEKSVKQLSDSQFKKLTTEQQKQFVELFGTDLDSATKLEKIDKFINILPQTSFPKPGAPAKQGSSDALNQILAEARKDTKLRNEVTQDINFVELIKQRMQSK